MTTTIHPFTFTSSVPTQIHARGIERAVLTTTPSYADAQSVVDRLSDAGFAVERTRIVGVGLTTVEQVVGRLTTGRATLRGAGAGAWFGLFVGLLVGLFTTGPAWLGLVGGGLVFGAVWGAVFGWLSHASTKGARDFSSVSGLEASAYEVQVDALYADEARRHLGPAVAS